MMKNKKNSKCLPFQSTITVTAVQTNCSPTCSVWRVIHAIASSFYNQYVAQVLMGLLDNSPINLSGGGQRGQRDSSAKSSGNMSPFPKKCPLREVLLYTYYLYSGACTSLGFRGSTHAPLNVYIRTPLIILIIKLTI